MSIYLNYLDRELGRSVGFELASELAASITDVILLCSFEQLYCGLALLSEQPAVAGNWHYFEQLVRTEVVEPITSYPSIEEFFAVKREEYRHDRNRYPAYFDDSRARDFSSLPFKQVSAHTTEALDRHLRVWSRRIQESEFVIRQRGQAGTVAEIVSKTLDQRQGEAITLSLFDRAISNSKSNAVARPVIARAISKGYTSRYHAVQRGRSPTGIPGLSYYDAMAASFPYLDYPVLKKTLGLLDFPPVPREDVLPLISARSFREHCLFIEEIRRLLLRLCDPDGAIQKRRANLLDKLASLSRAVEVRRPQNSWRDEFSHGADRLLRLGSTDLAQRMYSHRHSEMPLGPSLQAFCGRLPGEPNDDGSVDILFVVATSVEEDAVLERMDGGRGTIPKPMFVGSSTYYLGEFAGLSAALTRCEPGSLDRDGSIIVVGEAIEHWRPRAVILVGIAFGTKPEKEKLGDVLVSKSVFSYEPQRVGAKETISRGVEYRSTPTLFNRFRELHRGWSADGAKVLLGTLLSGEKLVDNEALRAQLLLQRPEAIGGEMEGAGLCAAAERTRTEWIVVKAICDWGTGKADGFHQLAAHHAISLVEHVLSHPRVLDGIYRAVQSNFPPPSA